MTASWTCPDCLTRYDGAAWEVNEEARQHRAYGCPIAKNGSKQSKDGRKQKATKKRRGAR